MSRIAKVCSWCGAKIPDELRLPPREIRKVEEEEVARKNELIAMEDARKVRDGKKALQELAAEGVLKAGLVIAKKLID